MAIEVTSGRAIDRVIYEEELAGWLPSKIIDCHVHIGLREHWGPIDPARVKDMWALDVANHQSWQDLRMTSRALFPRQEVHVVAFACVAREVDISAENSYVRAGLSDPSNHAVGLFATRPDWDADLIREAMSQGFLGIKPYPDLAERDTTEISIYDFLPRAHLAAVDALGGMLMLHLPRAGRVGDPDNVREVLEISDKYPNITIVLAHVGRAYCLPTARRGLPSLAGRENIYYDIAANLNADVFRYVIDELGPGRLLYGSDLPITTMRGVREHVGEQYFNYTDGAYSWNTQRKPPEEEAKYTCYLYEELRALIRALEGLGLGKDTCEQILYSNCAALIDKCQRQTARASSEVSLSASF